MSTGVNLWLQRSSLSIHSLKYHTTHHTPLFSQSTDKTDKWVIRSLYQFLITYRNNNIPANKLILLSTIRVAELLAFITLAFTALKFTTQELLLSSLNRIYTKRIHCTVMSPDTRRKLSTHMSNLRKNYLHTWRKTTDPHQRQLMSAKFTARERRPFMLKDWLHVFKSCPRNVKLCARTAVASGIALLCGARLDTVINIRLSDIRGHITQSVLHLYFDLTRLKGAKRVSTLSPHFATELQHMTEFEELFLFFFCLYLKQRKFNCDLLLQNKYLNDTTSLFNCKLDALRMYYNKLVRASGYPENYFTFHSCRQGFASQVMLSSVSHTSIADRYQLMCAVANWTGNSRHARQYFGQGMFIKKYMISYNFFDL